LHPRKFGRQAENPWSRRRLARSLLPMTTRSNIQFHNFQSTFNSLATYPGLKTQSNLTRQDSESTTTFKTLFENPNLRGKSRVWFAIPIQHGCCALRVGSFSRARSLGSINNSFLDFATLQTQPQPSAFPLATTRSLRVNRSWASTSFTLTTQASRSTLYFPHIARFVSVIKGILRNRSSKRLGIGAPTHSQQSSAASTCIPRDTNSLRSTLHVRNYL